MAICVSPFLSQKIALQKGPYSQRFKTKAMPRNASPVAQEPSAKWGDSFRVSLSHSINDTSLSHAQRSIPALSTAASTHSMASHFKRPRISACTVMYRCLADLPPRVRTCTSNTSRSSYRTLRANRGLQYSQAAAATHAITNAQSKYQGTLVDKFGRVHDYLRISLTERCSLRCMYCMPAEGVRLAPSADMLTTDEIVRLTDLFVRNGVSKIRLTGGEPLVRKDIVDVTQRIGQIPGISTLAMTTNGIALKRYLPALRTAGLNALNISLDSLNADKFQQITRRKGHSAVLESLHMALSSEFPSVKLNVVIMKNTNEDELHSFCDLTKNFPMDVRFIEFMPFSGNRWHDSRFLSYAEMLHRIGEHYGALERANDGANDTCKHYRVPGFRGRIGFITSMTDQFCGTCNRLRITADGNIKVCLFGAEEVSLRNLMRKGATDSEIVEVIQHALHRKHFALGGNNDMYAIAKNENRSMIRIGG